MNSVGNERNSTLYTSFLLEIPQRPMMIITVDQNLPISIN